MLQKWKYLTLLSLLAALLLTGCGGNANTPQEPDTPEEHAAEFFAMDTYMALRFYGGDPALSAEAEALVAALESELSVVKEDSAIYGLNHTGHTTLSDNGAELLRRTLALCEETGGALDISIYPIVRAWGFTVADPEADGGSTASRVPSPEKIAILLDQVDYRKIQQDGNDVSLPGGMEIDLGAVAKGYAGDKLAALLRDGGVESALLALGGNIQAVGSKPDGTGWNVGIQNPEGDGLLGVLSVSDRAVVTSGGYERYFTDENGNTWWHIMDPATGYPAKNGLISVTIVGESGLTCDALSTALFIMGPEKAVQFWRDHPDFDMALVTDSGTLLMTAGLAKTFAPAEDLAYTLEVIGND